MTTISGIQQQQQQSTSIKKPHSHSTKPQGYFDENGQYVCTNRKDMKAWLECAKKHGSCNGVTYYPAEKHLIFPDKKAEFGYSARIWDNANMIRSMFNIKPEVLKECNDPIYDINNPFRTKNTQPPKIIYFYEDGILP